MITCITSYCGALVNAPGGGVLPLIVRVMDGYTTYVELVR
jgi:hypothetical protein